jgi:RNA polymerase sigma factor (TIGR02999 family)
MRSTPSGLVTQLLADWQAGDDRALEQIMPRVYGELRRLAGRYLDREREGHTFDTHDLIHEAFLRLIDQRRVDWQSRSHFFAIAAQSMRRILVDHARHRAARRHGGDMRHLALEEVADLSLHAGEDLVAVDEALTELAQENEELARIVELRFFGGFEHDEIAALLGVSNPTVRRRWRLAKAWLYRRLSGQEVPAGVG